MSITIKTALSALALFLASTLTASAQWNSDFYSGAVRPTLESGPNMNYPRGGTTARPAQPGAQVARSGAPATASTSRPKLAGLLVAASGYKSCGLASLDGCAPDAKALYDWELKNGATKERLVALGDAISFKTSAPNYATIRKYLKSQSEVDCETLVVFLAGHGVGCGGKSFFCPLDVKKTSFPSDLDGDDLLKAARAANLLPIADVVSILRGAKAKHVVLLVDACRNVGDDENDFMNEFETLRKQLTRPNGGTFNVITSCSFKEKAQEVVFDGKNRGVFLYYFIEGLDGKADRTLCADNKITLIEAYNYAYSQVATATRGAQTPEIFLSDATSQPTLATVKASKPSPKDSDLQFLVNAGAFMLVEVENVNKKVEFRFNNEFVAKGVKWLSAALDVMPNNELALETRGRAYRNQGKYRGALNDFKKVGVKLQLYANAQTPLTDAEGKPLVNKDDKPLKPVEKAALLTIAAVSKDGKRLYVTEAYNAPLAKGGWIAASDVHWDASMAQNTTFPTRHNRSQGSVGAAATAQAYRTGTIAGGLSGAKPNTPSPIGGY